MSIPEEKKKEIRDKLSRGLLPVEDFVEFVEEQIEKRNKRKEGMEIIEFLDSVLDDTTEWAKQNPGNREFSCEHCGFYKASKPRCNKCEEEK